MAEIADLTAPPASSQEPGTILPPGWISPRPWAIRATCERGAHPADGQDCCCLPGRGREPCRHPERSEGSRRAWRPCPQTCRQSRTKVRPLIWPPLCRACATGRVPTRPAARSSARDRAGRLAVGPLGVPSSLRSSGHRHPTAIRPLGDPRASDLWPRHRSGGFFAPSRPCAAPRPPPENSPQGGGGCQNEGSSLMWTIFRPCLVIVGACRSSSR